MPRPDPQRSIDEARQNFDAVLHTPEFKRVHADDAHLNALIDLLAVTPGGRYLDLGTGNGYVAFGIAGRLADCRVTGIDIADKAIGRNVELAREKGLTNVDFAATDGIRLGVPVNAFDGVICRYALHHLPALRTTLRGVFEALKRSGRFVIADPVMDDDDNRDFINRFMALKPDGHVRIHTRNELLRLFAECGFQPLDVAMTSISFARPLNPDYRALIDATPPPIRQAYGIALQGDEVSARMDILNAAFAKALPGRE
jgi:ubiquinone/menaquinone biosynthesis C-methylase UbiE